MIASIFQFLLTHIEVGYTIVFFAAFFESVAFLGIFVPGTVVALFSGFVAEQWPNSYDPVGLAVIMALGSFLGAAASYLLGRFYGPPFFADNNFYLNRRYLVRAQKYFAEHGGKSIFTGNFLGPVRSLVPLVAGMSEMSIWRFLFWSSSASATWSILYVGFGYFFGASWEAVELWGTRLTVFLFGLAAAIVLNWLVGRFLVRHEKQVRVFVLSLAHSFGRAFIENEYIAAFIERHPRLCQFISNRLSPYGVLGLTFSISFILSLVILIYLLILIHAVVTQSTLIALDRRLLELVLFIRDPVLNRLMLWITNLAGWPILGFIGALTVFLIMRRRWARVFILVIGASSAAGIHAILKLFFDRPRPAIKEILVTAESASFPSGHSVMAVIFFGFLAYVAMGYARSWRTKIAIFLTTIFLIILVGLSRLYLGVHWPSDVLGGYLLGAWWLVIMITAVYMHGNFVVQEVVSIAPSRFLRLSNLITIVALILASWFYVSYTTHHPLQIVNVGTVEIFQRRAVADLGPSELMSLTKTTETLRGRQQTPINIIIVGSRDKFEESFSAVGWEIADPANLSNILRTIRSSLANVAYPSAPISPSFYEGRAQDIGIEKETDLKSARQRHHARFWLAPIVLADRRDIWLGTASFDSGVAYSPTLKFPTHTISPNIDKERDYIASELLATGLVARDEIVAFSEPTVGISGVGAPFFSDGQVRILWLRY